MVNLDAVSTPILDTFARCLTENQAASGFAGIKAPKTNTFKQRLAAKPEDIYSREHKQVRDGH